MSETEVGLNRVTLDMCDACMDGIGEECGRSHSATRQFSRGRPR